MADSEVVATLSALPHFPEEKYARACDMIDAGCIVALATDLNRAVHFIFSFLYCLQLLVYIWAFRQRAVTAFTINSAAAVAVR